MKNYQNLLQDVLFHGDKRQTRAGPTSSLFGKFLEFDLAAGFPAITVRKLYFESCANELAGFLRAEEDAANMGSSIWLADAERWHRTPGSMSRHPTDMGRVYGSQMRNWWSSGTAQDVDQLANVVTLIRANSTDRRLLVSMWNPGELDFMCLPPCHYAFQFFIENNKLSCMFHMRSVDIVLGLPFDIAYYALLTHIVAQMCKLDVGWLKCSLGDTHIYENHVDAVAVMLEREPLALPTLDLYDSATIDNFTVDMATLVGYVHHEGIKAKLNVG